MANNKKIVWIGIASALIIGGGAFLWWKNKKDKEEKRKQEEEEKEALEQEKASQGTISPPRTIQYPSTPFKNKAEGDSFRAWVNKKYPNYAKQNDLSLSGDFNNSFIRKAFQQYGAEYIKEGKTSTKTSSSSGFKVGSLVYLKTDNSSIYSFPDFKGDYIIGSVDKSITLDRPFAKYISNTGKGFLKVETIAFSPKCKPNERCMNVFQANKRIAYVPEGFVSNKPY